MNSSSILHLAIRAGEAENKANFRGKMRLDLKQSVISRLIFLGLPLIACGVMIWGWPLTQDNDLYLHLKSGERIWAEGKIPQLDIFTYTKTGSAEENHSWLGQLVFYGVFLNAGVTGLKVLNFLLVALVLVLLFRFVSQRSSDAAACVAACAALSLHHSFQIIRPLLFGEAYFAILIFYLFDELKPFRRRQIVALFVLTVLAINLHGSALIAFPISVVYTFCLWLRRTEWKDANFSLSYAIPAVCFAALCLSAKGFQIFSLSWELSQVSQAAGILEWQVDFPIRLVSADDRFQELWVGFDSRSLFVFLSLGTLMAAAFLRNLELHLGGLALFCTALATLGFRHSIYLLYPIAVSVAFWGKWLGFRYQRYRLAFGLSAFSLGFFLCLLFRVAESGYVFPTILNTAAFVKAAELQGRLLNQPDYGFYLTYELYPRVKVAIDRRMWLHRDYYYFEKEEIDSTGGVSLPRFLQRVGGAEIAIFSAKIDLAGVLGADWVLVYENNIAKVAVRRDQEENLRGVEQYYRARGISFDRTKGFDWNLVLAQQPDWLRAQTERPDWGRWPRASEVERWESEQRNYEKRMVATGAIS